jgi:hypothetical protein
MVLSRIDGQQKSVAALMIAIIGMGIIKSDLEKNIFF